MGEKLEFTGERFVPTEAGEIRLEHFHRYAVALGLAAARDVLDLASGEGYGTWLLANAGARSVVGADISVEAVRNAARKYSGVEGLRFEHASASRLPFEAASFDLVVSFETIEHLAEQREMVAELRRVLRPSGVLVISSPNRPVYSAHSDEANPFHVKELDFAELDALLRERFAAVRYFGQRLMMGSLIQALDKAPAAFRAWTDLGRVVAPHAGALREPTYFVAVCAAEAVHLPSLDASIMQQEGLDLIEQYRGFARWARAVDAELREALAQYARLDTEHHRIAAWGQGLERELAAERQELGRELSGMRERVVRLTAENDAAREKGAAMRAELEALTRRLAEREAETQMQAVENARLGTWVASLTTEIDRLKLEGAEAAHHRELARAALVHSEVDRASLRAEIGALRDSTSWKLTAPVRAAKIGGIRLVAALMRAGWVAARRTGGFLRRARPLSPFERRRLAGLDYERLPRLFAGEPSYEAWAAKRPEVLELAALLAGPDPARVGGLVPAEDTSRRPRVSIVVPVYGQLDYTLRCLRSILAARSAVTYEIIVVDDCSPDPSVEALSRLPSIRLVGNDANQGFIRTCNHGARVARGQLLLFLNNDTEVEPGFLDALAQTFDDVPRCGLAGSMLLYPDGRLQEAGGIIWNDGSGWNYGNGDDPRRPEFNYLRDVDYCSGASMMVPAELFARLGGFDERYLPAYGEDSDLAFRVRQAGYRVLFQPKSRVIHHEGVTSGKDVTRGVKAHQVDNARKLFERWSGELATHGEPGIEPLLAKDRNIAGRVLVVDHTTPTPDQDAGSITALNLMRLLQAQGFKVTFAPEDSMVFVGGYADRMQQLGIECLYSPFVPTLRAHLSERGHEYDLVVLFRAEVARRHLDAIELHCPQARVVFHTSDLHHLREGRQAELEGSDAMRLKAARTRAVELSIIRRANATIVHSILEKRMLDEELGLGDASRVFVFEWAIPVPGTNVPFGPRQGMLFVGGYQHPPNVDAVEYFVRDIFPLIRERLPEARFYVVGSRAPERLQKIDVPGVEYVGFAADLRPIMDQCRLSVAPLRYGAGIKGKVLTSMSHGLPCVATSIGAEGMNLADGENLLVADSPRAFADQVLRLHEDRGLWEHLSANGLRYVVDNASMAAGERVALGLLGAVGVGSRPRQRSLAAPGRCFPGEVDVRDRAGYEAFRASDLVRRQRTFEQRLAAANSGTSEYRLPGWCDVCGGRAQFLVDRHSGAIDLADGTWEPNWRERLVCPGCQMNSRQRAIAARVKAFVAERDQAPPEIYLTEQVTPAYGWLSYALPAVRWTGSEYFGPGVAGGTVNAAGIRHEDLERLSFRDGSFDMVASSDVLEHVSEPARALAEILRVLRPGGVLLLTVPFHANLDAGVRRASIGADGLVHHHAPVYHGNPVSPDGSLVFTDFGWDFLDQMRACGFRNVVLRLYWSDWRGYLGVGQHYIQAVKT